MKQSAPLHFRRIEIKYLLPLRLIPAVVSAIAPYMERDPFLVEEGKGRTSYPVSSLYYDSADLQAYHEKRAGILSRAKVRLRTYAPSFNEHLPIFLEIKRRWDLAIAKDRFLCPRAPLLRGDPLDLSHVIDVLVREAQHTADLYDELCVLRSWYNLRATMFVRYVRHPFVGRHDRTFRVTVDRELEGLWFPASIVGDVDCTSYLRDQVILELKCNHRIPAWFHALVQSFQLERLSLSKYALAVQALHPARPSLALL